MTVGWALIAASILVMWGLWGFFAKVASSDLGWKIPFLVQGFANTGVYLVGWLMLRPQFSEASTKGVLFSVLAGVLGSAGTALFFLGLERARIASVFVPLVSLYPVITILLLFLILHERVSLTQGLGLLFAVLAMVLLAL